MGDFYIVAFSKAKATEQVFTVHFDRFYRHTIAARAAKPPYLASNLHNSSHQAILHNCKDRVLSPLASS